MGSLERVLEQDVAKGGAKTKNWKSNADADLFEFAPEPEDEKDLEPSPLAVSDAVYDDDADDDVTDLGFQMGRMRLSDRIGGFFRPKMAEELTVSLNEDKNDQSAPQEMSTSSGAPIPHLPGMQNPSYGGFLAPGPHYIAPSSSFLFSSGQTTVSLIDFLPSKAISDRLLNQYWACVHPLCRVVHRPSFLRRYSFFWEEIQTGLEPAGSLQAIVFAALFSGVVSMSEDSILMEFGANRKDLVDNFQMGTETALARANVIRTTKIETLQALVMYMIPLCRGEISRSHSALVGTALRIAECMGLHRDGTQYGLGPVDTHVRRLVWYQICYLDIRTCEAQGPRPHIKADEFDTQLPLNVDDVDLEGPQPPAHSVHKWTDMTISLIRMECNEIHRVVWVDRARLEKKKISLTAVLGKIENFRKVMKEKYLSSLDDRIPLQRLGRLICDVLCLRMHAMVLHRYHTSAGHIIPGSIDRLRQIVISSGIECTELAIEIETSPALKPWAWYASAYQQYHFCLLLLLEIFYSPTLREADRMWACLDYVFDIPPHIPKDQKARWVVTQVRDKMGIYISARKIIPPAGMAEPGPRSNSTASMPSPGSTSSVEKSSHDSSTSTNTALGDLNDANLFNSGPPRIKVEPAYAVNQNPVIVSTTVESVKDDQMIDIDWHEWDKLFPPDANVNYMV
ncbi:MAG: hypothetical protein LQ342_006108 [Letrouitia transgressa]|nr:MAG: hypothetical protein LQ342_006108 [Letrouitia transgressa]